MDILVLFPIEGSERYVHHLDCGDHFTDVYIWHRIIFYALFICSLLYVNIPQLKNPQNLSDAFEKN